MLRRNWVRKERSVGLQLTSYRMRGDGAQRAQSADGVGKERRAHWGRSGGSDAGRDGERGKHFLSTWTAQPTYINSARTERARLENKENPFKGCR